MSDTVTPDKDYAFAIGTGTLTSKGTFTITRKGNIVTVQGEITHTFTDIYDWELGLAVQIGDGGVSDTDMKYLEIYKGAQPFKVSANWTSQINRSYNLKK